MGVTQSFRSEGTVISAVGSHWKSPKQSKLAFDKIPQRNRLCPGFDRTTALPISFFLNREDTVDLAIVGPEGNVRRVLVENLEVQGNRRHCVLWDQLDDEGLPVHAGRYRLRVSLAEADRVATAGEVIRIRPSEVPRIGTSQ